MSEAALTFPRATEPPLTRRQRSERTAEALEAAHHAGPDDRQDLLDYVVKINMGVARSVASRYQRRGIDEDDLLQVAYLALTRAARNFDTERHKDFLSYAVRPFGAS